MDLEEKKGETSLSLTTTSFPPLVKQEESIAMNISLDEEETKEPQIYLVSTEGDKLLVSSKIAMQSELVKTMIEGDKLASDIPLPNVKNTILAKVMEYLKYHVDNQAREIEKPLKSANMAEVVCQFDADFVDVDQEILFELILAANYMDIKPLLDLCCASKYYYKE